jgi:hypothetical protein
MKRIVLAGGTSHGPMNQPSSIRMSHGELSIHDEQLFGQEKIGEE